MRTRWTRPVLFALLLGVFLLAFACSSAPRRPDKEGVRDRAEQSQHDMDREDKKRRD